MKKIEAYEDMEQAMLSLDNGGRFYNLLAKANNRVISPAEVGKVIGASSDKQKMVLYLELSLAKLSHGMKCILLEKLTPELRLSYEKYKPQILLPCEAEEKGKIDANAIINGIPKLIDAKNEFKGFIIMPIMAGNVMSMMMIPIMDKYEVYELMDEKNGESFFIAHAKGETKLPQQPLKIAGIIKELKPNKNGEGMIKKFLEASYYLQDE
ncbi:MAG: hypothetical protein ABIP95_05450 [Pelobium sp.]